LGGGLEALADVGEAGDLAVAGGGVGEEGGQGGGYVGGGEVGLQELGDEALLGD